MAQLDIKDSAKSAVAIAEESLERISSASAASTLRYTTSVSRAFDALKKDIERLGDTQLTRQAGAYDADRLREGHARYMGERRRLCAQEVAFEEERLGAMESLDRASWDRRASYAQTGAAMMSNTLQNLYVATGSKHRAMFEAMKAFAVAETVIQTYRAAQGAYAALAPIPIVGPALGVAAAAAAVASGLARVEQIRGMRPEGATGTIDAGGRANPQYHGGSPSAYPAPSRVDEARPSQYITVQINNPLSEQNWQKIVEDNIVPALREASDRNISVNITKTA